MVPGQCFAQWALNCQQVRCIELLDSEAVTSKISIFRSTEFGAFETDVESCKKGLMVV